MDKFEDLSDLENILHTHSGFICALGTRNETTVQEFKKADFRYPVNFAKVAKSLKIPYFSLLSYEKASKESIFIYAKTKGETEDAIKALGLRHLTIFKPALITGRDTSGDVDNRWQESLGPYIPFMSKVHTKVLAFKMAKHCFDFL